MEIVIILIACILCVLTGKYIVRKYTKSKKLVWELELDENLENSKPAAVKKQSINTPFQESERKDSSYAFDDSDLWQIEEMVSGSGLKMREIRSGAYVTDLLDMYKDLTIETVRKDKYEQKFLTELGINKNPKNYWDCYMNFYEAISLTLGEVYMKILATHIDTLAKKREQLIITDDYGHNDCEKWDSEKKKFIKNIATPYISKEFNGRHGSSFKLILKFIEGPNDTEMPDFTFNMMDYYIDKLLSIKSKK